MKLDLDKEYMKIKKYVKPELIDLNHTSVHGNCAGGSADAADCHNGGSALFGCHGHGTLAFGSCHTHGSAAIALCYTVGNLPGLACSFGSIK